jgi:hypothetical protein
MVWLVGGLLLLALLMIVLAVGVFGTTEDDVGLVAVIPVGGRGDRAEIFDREGHRKGYGVRRPDGSWAFFDKDGSSLDVIPRPDVVEKYTGDEATRIILQPRRGR